MGQFTRWSLGVPLAGGVTAGLFLFMTGLIQTEFAPQEGNGQNTFELNPVVEEIETVQRQRDLPDAREVKTPPAPERIETPQADIPSFPVAPLPGDRPVFDPPTLPQTPIRPIIADGDVQPILRPPPTMPARAERSGSCRVMLDVSADGTPFNVRATDCSESIFSRPTVRAVERWRYRPKVENGVEVTRQNVRNIVRFNLLDERGHLIPER